MVGKTSVQLCELCRFRYIKCEVLLAAWLTGEICLVARFYTLEFIEFEFRVKADWVGKHG